MEFNLKCKLENRISKENKEYTVLIIEEISKTVFLNDLEQKVLNSYCNKNLK